jgi:ethanolamine utilization protein EutJ
VNPGAASLLAEAAAVIAGNPSASRNGFEPRRVGVDLGTATMVLLVLDERGTPLAGRMVPAHVVRDGLVLDFIGAVDRLRELKAEVEAELETTLTNASAGFPPGVPEPERQAIAHVVQTAGMDCTALIDEPSAANNVLGMRDGAIVDIGGGTTGIAVLQGGEVVYTADEATGGTHFNLVIAGAFDIEYEAAERLKETPEEQSRLLGVVRPVIEKIGLIIDRHIEGWDVPSITLVGGASAFQGMSDIIAERTGIPTSVAPETQLVTPLGIALGEARKVRRLRLRRTRDGSPS